MSAQSNLDTMHKYFDLLFGKEMDELLSMFTDDINWFIVPTNMTIKGKAQFRAMAKNHWAASPDRTKTMLNVFAQILVSPKLNPQDVSMNCSVASFFISTQRA